MKNPLLPAPVRTASLALCLALLSACPSGEPPGPPPAASDDPRRNVMVVDDGFDVTVAELQRLVVAQFTMACTSAPVVDDPTMLPAKETLLGELRTPSQRCRLRPGIVPKADPLARVAQLKDCWNAGVRSGRIGGIFTQAEATDFNDALRGLGKTRFHGTATAGTIAYDNPAVRLVLVERPLGDAATLMQEVMCLAQEELDRADALLNDTEVRAAYVDGPPTALEEDMAEAAAKHRVGLRNESFGPVSRLAIEEILAAKGCPPVELRKLFTTMGELDRARAETHPETMLVVRAAGNEHSMLDGAADDPSCYVAPYPRLVVGAYGLGGELTSFTNYGTCVDVYAPGTDVIAPIPGGWLLPVDGTSFSSPLVARLISRDQKGAFSPASARDGLLAMRDSMQRIPLARFPSAILYDPKQATTTSALTAGVQVRDRLGALRVSADELRRVWRLVSLGRRR